MKKFIVVLSLISFLSSCGEKKEETKEVVTESTVEVISPEGQFEYLIELDQILVKNDLTVDKSVAKRLFNAANDFLSNNAGHEKSADALELAAKSAEALGKYNEAIDMLHRLSKDFVDSEKTPSYLYNKARILEEKLGKKENAKAAYEDLISRFPNDPLAISAQQYLDMNYMEMSDEELIEFLESQSQSAE